jgi:hypothetical protein
MPGNSPDLSCEVPGIGRCQVTVLTSHVRFLVLTDDRQSRQRSLHCQYWTELCEVTAKAGTEEVKDNELVTAWEQECAVLHQDQCQCTVQHCIMTVHCAVLQHQW